MIVKPMTRVDLSLWISMSSQETLDFFWPIMARKLIPDYYLAIGAATDRMTEQDKETEEPCEFNFCFMISLC